MGDYFLPAIIITSGLTMATPYAFLINEIGESVKTYMSARHALDCIKRGSEPREYTNQIQDAKIDSLAGWMLGGRKALYQACREGRARLKQNRILDRL